MNDPEAIEVTGRRPTGQLEAAVLEFLWAVGDPSTPGDVHEAVAPDLAYTTVMTVLTRLHAKGALERERQGRPFAYWPSEVEAKHRADQMRDQLDAAGDRHAVLSSFVDALTAAEADELRRILREAGE